MNSHNLEPPVNFIHFYNTSLLNKYYKILTIDIDILIIKIDGYLIKILINESVEKYIIEYNLLCRMKNINYYKSIIDNYELLYIWNTQVLHLENYIKLNKVCNIIIYKLKQTSTLLDLLNDNNDIIIVYGIIKNIIKYINLLYIDFNIIYNSLNLDDILITKENNLYNVILTNYTNCNYTCDQMLDQQLDFDIYFLLYNIYNYLSILYNKDKKVKEKSILETKVSYNSFDIKDIKMYILDNFSYISIKGYILNKIIYYLKLKRYESIKSIIINLELDKLNNYYNCKKTLYIKFKQIILAYSKCDIKNIGIGNFIENNLK